MQIRFACFRCRCPITLSVVHAGTITLCPACKAELEVPELVDAPPPPAAPEPPPPPPEPAGPLLTLPHTCNRCRSDMPGVVLGRRAGDVECPFCEHNTAAYAVQHRCPHPDCGRLLETPLRYGGGRASCPACGTSVDVPDRSLIAAAFVEGEDLFAVRCPLDSCRRLAFVRAAGVGRLGVCPHCLNPWVVPRLGEQVRPGDPIGDDESRVRCRDCRQRLPPGANRCPWCGGSVDREP